MSIALQLSGTREAKLLHDIRVAIAATSPDELKSWGGRTLDILGEVTIRRGKNFGSLVGRVWDFLTDEARGLLSAIRRNVAVPHLRARGAAAGEQAQALGRDFTTIYETLGANLKNRPKDTAPKLVAGVLGFLVSSGGVDGDGGIPDLDFLGGIGAHRSILTHSVISGIVVETLVLGILDLSRTVYRNLPEGHDPLWEDLNAASDDIFSALTKGLSAGIAYHLAIDATVDGGGTFKDFPVPLSEGGNQAILAGNAVAEGFDAGKRASETTVNEIESRIFKTFREAAEFAKRDTSWIIVRATDAQGFRLMRKAPKGARPPLTTRSRGRA